VRKAVVWFEQCTLYQGSSSNVSVYFAYDVAFAIRVKRDQGDAQTTYYCCCCGQQLISERALTWSVMSICCLAEPRVPRVDVPHDAFRLQKRVCTHEASHAHRVTCGKLSG
jgi:hypothetical protein